MMEMEDEADVMETPASFGPLGVVDEGHRRVSRWACRVRNCCCQVTRPEAKMLQQDLKPARFQDEYSEHNL